MNNVRFPTKSLTYSKHQMCKFPDLRLTKMVTLRQIKLILFLSVPVIAMAMHSCGRLPFSSRPVWTRIENLTPDNNPPPAKRKISMRKHRNPNHPAPLRSKWRISYLWPTGWFYFSLEIRLKTLLKSGTKHGKRLKPLLIHPPSKNQAKQHPKHAQPE